MAKEIPIAMWMLLFLVSGISLGMQIQQHLIDGAATDLVCRSYAVVLDDQTGTERSFKARLCPLVTAE